MGSLDFEELETVGPELFLDPQVGHAQMPDLSEPPPPADADGGRGIGVQVDLQFYA